MSNLNRAFDKAKEIAKANKGFTYTECMGFLYLEGMLSDKETESAENYFMSKNVNMEVILGRLTQNKIVGVN